MVHRLALASRKSRRSCAFLLAMILVSLILIVIPHIALSLFANTLSTHPSFLIISNISKATPTTNKKTTNPKKRKHLSSPPGSSSATLGSSSPPPNSDDETSTRPLKKPKTKAKSTTASRAKKPIISTPETEEDINNAKAIAAGRARYAADKLAAEMKKEDGEHPIDDAAAEGENEELMGMNIDSGEDEGLTAYELVKQEVFGEGVEF